MEAIDLENVSPDARTGRVLDAFVHLKNHITDSSDELATLNKRLADLPAHFISGAARMLTPHDVHVLTERILALSDAHDLYNAEMIILVEQMDGLLSALDYYVKKV